MGLLGSVLGGIVGAIGGPVGAVIGGPAGNILGSVISGAGSSFQSAELAKQQYEYNLALQQQQQGFIESMWNKTNEYNTPEQQVKRLRNAGLNANLAYGSLSGNVANNAPSGGLSSVSQAPFTAIQAAAQVAEQMNLDSQVQKNIAEAKLLGEQSDLVQANTIKTILDSLGVGYDNEYKKGTLKSRVALADYMVDDAIQGIELKKSAARLNEVNANLAPQYYELKKRYTDAQVDDIMSQIGYRMKDIALRYRLGEAHIAEMTSQIALNYANRDLSDANKAAQDIVNRYLPEYKWNEINLMRGESHVKRTTSNMQDSWNYRNSAEEERTRRTWVTPFGSVYIPH